MVEIELDGQKVEVAEGSMVMHAAEKAGTYIPHFCYHKKLSIAANCRMCLVDVEKAPKPMPACATPVTQGMVVRTKIRQGHQGPEVGDGVPADQSPAGLPHLRSGRRMPVAGLGCRVRRLFFALRGRKARGAAQGCGPLISMEEMSRCIHCTRCVRFGQEVAGVMELGMLHRGEHPKSPP
jgi:NADH-quinone oxidoreductase subunit G